MIETTRFKLTDRAAEADTAIAARVVERLVPESDQLDVLKMLGIASEPAPEVAAALGPGALEANVRARVWALSGVGLSPAAIVRATLLPKDRVREILADPPTSVVVNPAAASASKRRRQLRDEVARLLGAGVSADVVPALVRCSRSVVDEVLAELADLPVLPPVLVPAE